jgi:ubiquinol-cytochrome c reductase cytochrome b subunit
MFGMFLNLLKVNYVMLVKSHLQSYPCPLQINTFYNFGFLLGMTMIIQILTGIMLTMHYNSDTSLAFQSILYMYYEVYNGNILRYFHSNGASIVFLCIYIHISRSLFYQSYLYNPNTFSTGLVIFLMLMAIAFLGYTLPYGQMSFWGATVITNLLSPFPNIIEFLLGGFTVSTFCSNGSSLSSYFLSSFPFFFKSSTYFDKQ